MRILWQSYTAPGTDYLRALRDSVQALAAPDVQVDVVGLDPPDRSVHRLSELECAVRVVATNLDVAERGYDAVVVGHFQDGGVAELRAALDIPVIGLGETAMHAAAQLGDAFGLVTINPGFLAYHRAQVRGLHLESRFAGVVAMDADAAICLRAFEGSGPDIDLVVEGFTAGARALVAAGADVVIPAGGLPALLLWACDRVPDLAGATVLDPMSLAVGQAEVWARAGSSRVRPGRRGSFALPTDQVRRSFCDAINHRSLDIEPPTTKESTP